MALRDRVFAGVATAALSLGGAFGISNANAQTAQPTPAVATQQVNIPAVNARGFNDAYLRIAAARESGDSVVLIVYGNNRELYNRVKKAAADVTAEGYPVKGIYVANGPEAVEIYADAQSITTHNSPMSLDAEGFIAQTHSAIRHAYTDIIIPRRQQRVATQTPTVASTLE